MLKEHRDIIRTNLSTLVEKTDISRIIPILQKKSVLSQEAILRILVSIIKGDIHFVGNGNW